MVQIKFKCEKCQKIHDASYGSGRFCSAECARSFASLVRREEANVKVSLKLGGKGADRFVGTGKCLQCSKDINNRKKFCSNACQIEFNYVSYIRDWKDGKEDGCVSIHKDKVSNHIRRYLFEKYEDKCSRCGWNEKNPLSNKIPLQVEHIDGNYLNNSEINLVLLCPNCHSLTPTFGALNVGKGRYSRNKIEKEKLFERKIKELIKDGSK